ncbi:MAG: aminodeoxychorismate/anthranilate synthase component II [Acidobacteriota bacterium]|nr:aminodeoxychorismate/anthranilate synthase component II [Acidobacteriota bacterium]
MMQRETTILIIDNYDSFTYNLVQYLGEIGCDVKVHRNDAVTLAEVDEMCPDGIVISPGPGLPNDAGISIPVIEEFAGQIPILGVCLGHQAIGEVFGGKVVQAPKLMHGKISSIYHEKAAVLRGLPNPFEATRYHSLVVRREDLPECLVVNAWTEDGVVMGLQHQDYSIFGVQFHPESIMTREGMKILENFVGNTTISSKANDS